MLQPRPLAGEVKALSKSTQLVTNCNYVVATRGGEPDVGNPPVRFGGREADELGFPYPYQQMPVAHSRRAVSLLF